MACIYLRGTSARVCRNFSTASPTVAAAIRRCSIDWRKKRTSTQAYSDFLEQELLDLFERAAGRSPPEVELMRECSDILFALNEGDHLQSRFVFFVVTQVCVYVTCAVHGSV